MREDCEHRFALRTLDAPDGETTQPDTDVMRVACQAPAAVTGAFVCMLTAEGEDEGQCTFEERLVIVKQVSVGRFIVEIDGDSGVLPRLCGCCGQCVAPRSSGLGS
jgi:hypothetical protein